MTNLNFLMSSSVTVDAAFSDTVVGGANMASLITNNHFANVNFVNGAEAGCPNCVFF